MRPGCEVSDFFFPGPPFNLEIGTVQEKPIHLDQITYSEPYSYPEFSKFLETVRIDCADCLNLPADSR